LAAGSAQTIAQSEPGIDGGQEPGRAVVERDGRRRSKIQGRAGTGVAENLPGRLLSRPARPYDAGAAVAHGIAQTIARKDAWDHVAVHGDIAPPAVRDVHILKLGEDIDEGALEMLRRPRRIAGDAAVAA